MTSAARGIKGVIKTIDRNIIEKAVERQYDLNIEKVENAALVADFKIQAKGSSSLIAKEQQAVRRAEFLKTTQNQIDFSHHGPRRPEIPSERHSPGARTGRGQGGSRQPAATPPGRRGRPPFSRFCARAALTRTLNPAGEPVAGKDFRLFQGGAIPNG